MILVILIQARNLFKSLWNFQQKLTKGALINGFYYELLDSEIGEILEFVIDKETDANSDGLDDDTGDEILGYAKNCKLIFFLVQV